MLFLLFHVLYNLKYVCVGLSPDVKHTHHQLFPNVSHPLQTISFSPIYIQNCYALDTGDSRHAFIRFEQTNIDAQENC